MTERRKEKILSVLRHRQPNLTIVLEDIHDPHNVSAILRTADAVGIQEVQLLYTSEKFPKIGKKSSASASKWMKRRPFGSVKECYKQLRAESFEVYATHLGKRTKSLYDLDLTGKVALVFGNEHRGVTVEAAKEADENFQIPMTGMIESLNVSVACAVSLYEVFRQREASGRQIYLDEDTVQRLFAEWMKK